MSQNCTYVHKIMKINMQMCISVFYIRKRENRAFYSLFNVSDTPKTIHDVLFVIRKWFYLKWYPIYKNALSFVDERWLQNGI